MRNRAGNVVFRPRAFHRPRSLGELQRLVSQARHARALGTGHSFSRIAATDGDLISLAGLPKTISIDAARRAVTISANVSYTELAPKLNARGYALPNLASLPHINVAGACQTATHGSGSRNASLAGGVSQLRMVTADGELLTLGRDAPAFRGAVAALGCLGIVTSLTLDIVAAFGVRQHVCEGVPLEAFCEHFGRTFASGYSVSAFTGWASGAIDQLWVKERDQHSSPALMEILRLYAGRGVTVADGPRHPVPGMPPEYCTQQLGVPGPWHQRLPHFRAGFVPSAGNELQSEYLLPREAAPAAVRALQPIGGQIAPVLQVCEIRTIAADELWLSPCYGRDSAGIHFTWIAGERAVRPVMAAVEERLAPLGARPHWGKLFRMPPELVQARYERLDDFRRLAAGLDPAAKFSNELTRTYLGIG
jgi:xylitol oxidase